MIPRTWLLLLIAAPLFCPDPLRADTNATDWWSFRPATNAVVPENTKRRAWIINPIDAFILERLEQQRLEPSREADRRTLIRRLTFNLTGLPPRPEEVSEFIHDAAPDAYEKLVDRLLASPRYGERWARHWLDTVHYGETHGYDKDKPRLNAWPYRDYVINALNSDKPYARFIEEQLAADVLFPDESQWLPALGFIAAGPWDFVGHVELPISKMDGLLARYNDRDDMVMNAMSTFQSLTVHCARCHDHKFDPITQRDYYGLQAVFAGVDRADRAFDEDVVISRKRRELTQRIGVLQTNGTRLQADVARIGGEPLRELERQIANLKKPAAQKSAAFGYHSQISPKPDAVKWVQIDLGERRDIDRIVFVGCHDDFNNIGAGFGFPVRFRIEASDEPDFRTATVLQDKTAADSPNPGVTPHQLSTTVTARYIRFTATRLAARKGDYIFALAELMVFNRAGDNLSRVAKVTALDSIEAPPRWRKENLTDGYYFGMGTNATAADDLARLQGKRDELIRAVVPRDLAQRVAENEAQLALAQKQLSALPKPRLVYAAATDFPANGSFIPSKGPRPVHLLKRGDVKRPGEEMKPMAVAAVPGVDAEFRLAELHSEGQRRAALAKWITHTNNVLTRRSIVNRIWHYHFGRGLVDTPNDFGRMGGQPSHPELLDWLARWFLDNGESLKQLHRLIVTSATYRQSSMGGNQISNVDSANRLLWRMNRTRLDAEQFHDALLAISGRLDLEMGGPSVQQFWFKDDHSPVYDYARYDFDSPGSSRRSIYRFIVRSVPDPLMDALDCPDANILTPVRNTTMTALQALAALNDAFVIRQCEAFAARLLRERGSLAEQITRACELAWSRTPTETERVKLVAHARKHGLESACRVLFNSNEFMFLD